MASDLARNVNRSSLGVGRPKDVALGRTGGFSSSDSGRLQARRDRRDSFVQRAVVLGQRGSGVDQTNLDRSVDRWGAFRPWNLWRATTEEKNLRTPGPLGNDQRILIFSRSLSPSPPPFLVAASGTNRISKILQGQRATFRLPTSIAIVLEKGSAFPCHFGPGTVSLNLPVAASLAESSSLSTTATLTKLSRSSTVRKSRAVASDSPKRSVHAWCPQLQESHLSDRHW
jgi:hypothetical protein